MADALTAIAEFLTKPPAQFAAGGVLGVIVWKFFETVENLLTEKTKFEIAVWLVGVKTADKVPWPETFARLFDRVFGEKHLSLKCFSRSVIASLSVFSLNVLFLSGWPGLTMFESWRMWTIIVFTNCVPDYLSLVKTRFLLKRATEYGRRSVVWVLLLPFDAATSYLISGIFLALVVWVISFNDPGLIRRSYLDLLLGFIRGVAPALLRPTKPGEGGQEKFFVYPAFFACIWLWLYAGSGFILKAARRFDIGFDWFNRKFDIEKKPLSAIGLVAGCIVAVIWWGVVVVRWIV
jgi:hypothetical protein